MTRAPQPSAHASPRLLGRVSLAVDLTIFSLAQLAATLLIPDQAVWGIAASAGAFLYGIAVGVMVQRRAPEWRPIFLRAFGFGAALSLFLPILSVVAATQGGPAVGQIAATFLLIVGSIAVTLIPAAFGLLAAMVVSEVVARFAARREHR